MFLVSGLCEFTCSNIWKWTTQQLLGLNFEEVWRFLLKFWGRQEEILAKQFILRYFIFLFFFVLIFCRLTVWWNFLKMKIILLFPWLRSLHIVNKSFTFFFSTCFYVSMLWFICVKLLILYEPIVHTAMFSIIKWSSLLFCKRDVLLTAQFLKWEPPLAWVGRAGEPVVPLNFISLLGVTVKMKTLLSTMQFSLNNSFFISL